MRRLIVLVALVFAACGGQTDTGVGLKLDDFPSGWTQYGESGKDSTCESVVAARKAASAYDRSATFERRPRLVATSTVFLYDDEAKAREAFAKLNSDATRACFAESLSAKGTQELEIAAAGDERAGLQVDVAKTDKHPAAAYQLVYVRSGRAVAELVFAGLFKPFDRGLREDLTAKVAARARSAS